MGDPKKLSEVASTPSPWTSALGPWALIRRAVGIQASNPNAAALEEAAIEEMRAAALEEESATEKQPGHIPPDDLARCMRSAGAHHEDVEEWLRKRPLDTPAAAFAREWIGEMQRPDAPRVLVLTGGTGAGKTLAGLGVLAWGVQQPRRRSGWPAARWFALPELLPLGEYERPGRDRWDEAMHSWLVVLDDLGSGTWNEYQRRRFEALLEHRMSSGLPTVVTTNLSPRMVQDDPKELGQRVNSRMSGPRARVAECGSRDRR